jgi:FKBP-type peptidyl-prolyl cis-trans isomerase
MKKYFWVPVILAVGVGALILITSDSPGGDTGKEGETVTTKSGLKYIDLKAGDGKEAKKGDTVLVTYTGWLKDGTKFDSNVGGEPLEVEIGVTRVIKGWHEGLEGMKAGGKRKLIIPPDLAYGKKGKGEIPPDAELTFEVEVVEIL